MSADLMNADERCPWARATVQAAGHDPESPTERSKLIVSILGSAHT